MSNLENYLGQMFPTEPGIRTRRRASVYVFFLIAVAPIDRSRGQLRRFLYEKHDFFNFNIINFPFLDSNILSSPDYGIFISLLIQHARAWSSYECFILKAVRIFNMLGYIMVCLQSCNWQIYDRYGDLIKQYDVPFLQYYITFQSMTIFSPQWGNMALWNLPVPEF